MSLFTKILISVGSIIILGALSFIIFKQIEISDRQHSIETQVVKQKELVDNIMRSQSQYATRDDINKFIKENGVNLKAIQEDLDKLHASISAVNVVTVHSSGQQGNNLPSTGTGNTNPNPPSDDPYGYQHKTQLLSLVEQFGNMSIPFGEVGFSAWQTQPWSVNIPPREYHVTNVIGTDENQRTYIYNKFSVKVQDKDYDLKITKAETKQEFPTAKWSWFNPRLFVGIDGGVNVNQVKGEFTPSLDVGIMSYGRYKTQPDFSVLQVGAGFGTVSKKPQLIVTPVTYNVGQHLPLMNNMYVGPSVHIGTTGNFSVMAGIRVGL
jgi:hypothetical protein